MEPHYAARRFRSSLSTTTVAAAVRHRGSALTNEQQRMHRAISVLRPHLPFLPRRTVVASVCALPELEMPAITHLCTPLSRDRAARIVVIEASKFRAHTMQGISICGSVASPHGANYRRACVARNSLRLPCEINAVSLGAYSCHWGMHKLHIKTNGRRMNVTVRIRTNARWLFGGDGRSSDARLERSESANEDILIFYFQMDLQTRIQYALNIEQFDVAKQLREKLTEIETEIIRQREAKRGSSKTEAQDKALNLLRVRADLQKAIDSENYALAASLRDEIAKLEAESLAVSAKALAYQNVKYAFRLGQKVRHKVHGYRGVICGMDPVCCESKSWMETANVEKLSKGPNQPFYQVLVDVYVDPELLVAYVAEENLSVAEESEKGRFDHPYIEFLFFGEDTAGDFIPIKQLREKYDQPRYEASGDEDDDDGDTISRRARCLHVAKVVLEPFWFTTIN